MSLENLCKTLNTSQNGHTSKSWKKMHQKYGDNVLVPPKQDHFCLSVIRNLFTEFNIIMAIVILVDFAKIGIQHKFGNQDDQLSMDDDIQFAVSLILIIFITTTISTYVESENNKMFQELQKMGGEVQSFSVMRDGCWESIKSDKLVPGDLVRLNSGDVMQADFRLLSANGFQVTETALTGEPDSKPKTPNSSCPDKMNSPNFVAFTSLATQGSATGIVLATGNRTVVGELAKAATTDKVVETCYMKELSRYLYVCFINSIGWFLFILLLSVLNGNTDDIFTLCVAIIIAHIPTGIPLTLAISRIITSKYLQKKDILTKSLTKIDDAAYFLINCFDKTGTLTEGVLSIDRVKFKGEQLMELRQHSELSTEHFNFLCQCPTTPLTAQIRKIGSFPKEYSSNANVLDQTIANWCQDANRDQFIANLAKTSVVYEKHFNSSIKMQWKVLDTFESASKVKRTQREIILIGAPEVIKEYCNGDLSDETKVQKDLASTGARTVSFARKELKSFYLEADHDFEKNPLNLNSLGSFEYMGCIFFKDPIKEGVDTQILKMRAAGVRTAMITGDCKETALHVAKATNIVQSLGKTADQLVVKLEDLPK